MPKSETKEVWHFVQSDERIMEIRVEKVEGRDANPRFFCWGVSSVLVVCDL